MASLEKSETGGKAKTLPPPGEHVVVHCPGFSCLGYLDQHGTWKNVFSNEALPEVIDYSPIA